MAKGHALINRYDALLEQESDPEKQMKLKVEANRKVAQMLKKETASTLDKVLYELSNQMKNAYSRSDAQTKKRGFIWIMKKISEK